MGGGKVIVMMIMSLNLPVNSFPLRRRKRDSSQTVVLGFTLLYLVPIMDLFQMMGMGGTGLISWVRGDVASCLLELWRKYSQD